MRDEIIPDYSSQDRHVVQRPGKHFCNERFENPKFTGFFQGQPHLNAGRVAGYDNNTCAKLDFEDPPTKQTLEDETSLLN